MRKLLLSFMVCTSLIQGVQQSFAQCNATLSNSGNCYPITLTEMCIRDRYSPWIVANLKVKAGLEERNGADLSWDNVIYGGNSLGYVDAGHQKISLSQPVKNLTYYKPLKGASNAETRKVALSRLHKEWVEEILTDLVKVHPNLEEQLLQVDIALWGHAMIQPLPGWIWGETRNSLQQSIGSNIHFAHTDIAGISIFEEAFYQGLNAAEQVKRFL